MEVDCGIQGLHKGYIGMMENRLETTIYYLGFTVEV